jgi:hypothetical protein
MIDYFKPKDIYTGKEYERDLLDVVDVEDQKYQERRMQLQEEAKKRGMVLEKDDYLPLEESIKLAMEFQPADPANPRKPFAKEFLLACREKLELDSASQEDMDRLKFYTAVGSPADIYHGRDGIMIFEDFDKKIYEIGVQVSKNPEKLNRSDVLIEEDVPDPSDDDFDKKILAVSEKYAEKFIAVLEKKKKEGKIFNIS